MNKNSRSFVFFMIGLVVLSGVAIAETITFRGNDIDQHSGELKDVSSIVLFNQPLIIEDKLSGRIKAIFNLPEVNVTIIGSQQINDFNDTSISFFGEVRNFDNINEFSRFVETNLNDGSSAGASFTATNDIGHTMRIGIGSSNLAFGGQNRNNSAIIAARTPADMSFTHGFANGWEWRSNAVNNISSLGTIRNVMNVSSDGDLSILGNFTGNQFYGEMFLSEIGSPVTTTIIGTGIANAVKVEGFGNGSNNGFTYNDSTLIAQVPGLYQVNYNLVYDDSANNVHVFGIDVNNILQENTLSAARLGTTLDLGNPSGTGFIHLEIDDIVNIVVADISGGVDDIDVLSANMNLVRVGS